MALWRSRTAAYVLPVCCVHRAAAGLPRCSEARSLPLRWLTLPFPLLPPKPDFICNHVGNRQWVDVLPWHGSKRWAAAEEETWLVDGEEVRCARWGAGQRIWGDRAGREVHLPSCTKPRLHAQSGSTCLEAATFSQAGPRCPSPSCPAGGHRDHGGWPVLRQSVPGRPHGACTAPRTCGHTCSLCMGPRLQLFGRASRACWASPAPQQHTRCLLAPASLQPACLLRLPLACRCQWTSPSMAWT